MCNIKKIQVEQQLFMFCSPFISNGGHGAAHLGLGAEPPTCSDFLNKIVRFSYTFPHKNFALMYYSSVSSFVKVQTSSSTLRV